MYVYLHLDPERLLENIKKRGRGYESSITRDYLQKIQNSYFSFFKQNTDNRYVIIDSNNIDFVENAEDYEKIVDIVFNKDYTKGINKVIL